MDSQALTTQTKSSILHLCHATRDVLFDLMRQEAVLHDCHTAHEYGAINDKSDSVLALLCAHPNREETQFGLV